MVGSVCYVGFLVEATGFCVLLDKAGYCLSGGQDRVVFWGVCELSMILGNLSVNG